MLTKCGSKARHTHSRKLQTACPLERTRLQFKMCIRSSWEERSGDGDLGVTSLTFTPHNVLFLRAQPHFSGKGWHSLSCFPTTKHSLVGYGLGAPPAINFSFPRHQCRLSPSCMVTFDPTEHLIGLPLELSLWPCAAIILPLLDPLLSVLTSVFLSIMVGFHSSFHPWPPSLFFAYFLGDFVIATVSTID